MIRVKGERWLCGPGEVISVWEMEKAMIDKWSPYGNIVNVEVAVGYEPYSGVVSDGFCIYNGDECARSVACVIGLNIDEDDVEYTKLLVRRNLAFQMNDRKINICWRDQ